MKCGKEEEWIVGNMLDGERIWRCYGVSEVLGVGGRRSAYVGLTSLNWVKPASIHLGKVLEPLLWFYLEDLITSKKAIVVINMLEFNDPPFRVNDAGVVV